MSTQAEPIVLGRRRTDWAMSRHGGEPMAPREPAQAPVAIADFSNIATILRRRSRLIAATVVLSVVGATCYALVMPIRYTATTSILLDPRGLQVLKNDISERTTSWDGQVTEAESQRYVIASRTVLAKVITDEKLDTHPLFAPRGPNSFARIMALFGVLPEPRDAFEETLRALEQSVTVKRQTQTYVIDLDVTTSDRTLSARLANAIAKTYAAQEMIARTMAARRSIVSLTERAAELRQQVRIAENRVEQFKAENNIVSAGGLSVKEQQLREAVTQLEVARTRRLELQSRLDQVRSVSTHKIDPEAISDALQSPTIIQLRTQYASAKKQEASLFTLLGARHPDYQAAVAQTRELRAQILDEITRIAQGTASDLVQAEATEKGLVGNLERLESAVSATQQASVALRELMRDAASKRTVYEAFLMRAKELDEQKALDTGNTRIITEASPSISPKGPSRLLVIAAGLLLGLAFGGTLAWLREQLDTAPAR
jgi:succinoglycan biosynthesis transport protein ExoP